MLAPKRSARPRGDHTFKVVSTVHAPAIQAATCKLHGRAPHALEWNRIGAPAQRRIRCVSRRSNCSPSPIAHGSSNLKMTVTFACTLSVPLSTGVGAAAITSMSAR